MNINSVVMPSFPNIESQHNSNSVDLQEQNSVPFGFLLKQVNGKDYPILWKIKCSKPPTWDFFFLRGLTCWCTRCTVESKVVKQNRYNKFSWLLQSAISQRSNSNRIGHIWPRQIKTCLTKCRKVAKCVTVQPRWCALTDISVANQLMY